MARGVGLSSWPPNNSFSIVFNLLYLRVLGDVLDLDLDLDLVLVLVLVGDIDIDIALLTGFFLVLALDILDDIFRDICLGLGLLLIFLETGMIIPGRLSIPDGPSKRFFNLFNVTNNRFDISNDENRIS